MQIKSISEVPNLQGKKVLLRVDFNVPLTADNQVQDATRITESLPTIKFLLSQKAKIIICSHLGRPQGVDENLRLNPVASKLSELLGQSVYKIDETVGEKAKEAANNLKESEILVLENTRFQEEEEACEANFTRELASLADIFVNDAFGTAHRRHASTAGVADYIPAYAGLLMEKEIKQLSKALQDDIPKPLCMIFGGAKIDTKIKVIQNFMAKADYILVGGGLANTFLYAQGYKVGSSLCEVDKVEIAKEILDYYTTFPEKFILPSDAVVASEISTEAQSQILEISDIPAEQKILDIGPKTREIFCSTIKKCQTVIWNGPLGLYEYPQFSGGTNTVADCIANHHCYSIIGGGDTTDAIKRTGLAIDKFSHVSTGGGACLEFLEGKTLPGISVLLA